jgi:hypothetical protein
LTPFGVAMCVLQMKDVEDELSPKALDNARRQIWWWSGALCFILVIAWPLLSLPAGVFSQVNLPRELTVWLAHCFDSCTRTQQGRHHMV